MPLMSLQTGGEIGRTVTPVINPANLQIIAYRIEGTLVERPDSYIMIDDIRELSEVGFIVDSADEIVNDGDVIQLDDIIARDFVMIGKTVIDRNRRKLGKVLEYTIDIDSFMIVQFNVKRPLFRSLSDTELLIHRTQIIEISDNYIVVDSSDMHEDATQRATSGSYVNPFRATNPVAENFDHRASK